MCVCLLGQRRISYNLPLISTYLNSSSLSYMFLMNSTWSKILMLLPKVNRWFKMKCISTRKCKMRKCFKNIINIEKMWDRMYIWSENNTSTSWKNPLFRLLLVNPSEAATPYFSTSLDTVKLRTHFIPATLNNIYIFYWFGFLASRAFKVKPFNLKLTYFYCAPICI